MQVLWEKFANQADELALARLGRAGMVEQLSDLIGKDEDSPYCVESVADAIESILLRKLAHRAVDRVMDDPRLISHASWILDGWSWATVWENIEHDAWLIEASTEEILAWCQEDE